MAAGLASQGIGFGPVNGTYGYRRGLPARIRALAQQHDAVIFHGTWQYNCFVLFARPARQRHPLFVITHGMLESWFRATYPFKHLKKWDYLPRADSRVLRDVQIVLLTSEQERLLARQLFWLYKVNEVVVGYRTSALSPDTKRLHHAFLQRFPQPRG